MTSNILADFRYGARSLWGRRGFAAIVMLTLALGIGVNVAIFSLFHQIVLRTLPVSEPERLVNLTDPGPDLPAPRSMSLSGAPDSIFSYPMFRDLERGQEPFVGIAGYRVFQASLSTAEAPRLETAVLVSGSYFSVLALNPAVGRLLGPQDDRIDGQAESVVLSHTYWQRELGSDPEVIGRTLIVNGAPLTVVGIAPAGFHGTTVGMPASVFVPITFDWVDDPTATVPNHDDRLSHWVYLFARLAPGVEREQAEAQINPLYRALLNGIEAPLYPGADEQALERFRTKSLALQPGAHGQSLLIASASERLETLFALSGVVLLLCCANVAGLMLVRGAARTGEMAVRASMGATRGRLASLLFAESLLLALPAALLSMPVALLTMRIIASGRTGVPPTAFDVDLDIGAVLVAVLVAVVSAVAFGLLPARGLTRKDSARALQGYGVRQTATKGVTRFRMALAAAQIALSMALLALAGVFAQSLANIARIDPGFAVDSVVTFSIAPLTSGYSQEASAGLLDRLDEELAAIPGVISAGSAEFSLLSGGMRMAGVSAEGAEGRVQETTYMNYISPGFLRALDMLLLAGRDFSAADAAGAPQVAIVNARFAERFGLGRDAVGQRITVRGTEALIVGVAADAKYSGLTGETPPQVFRPRAQSTEFGAASFYIRGARPPDDLMSAVRETAARVDSVVPITNLRTMQQQVRESVATERFAAGMSTAFAALATVLAGLGLYGVLAYTVAQRSREIGLRFALGAPASRIRAMVLRQVMAIAAVGTLAGGIGAVLLGRAAESLLFGVDAAEPVALFTAAALLTAVVLGAAYVPARRASSIDPIAALRYE